MNDPSPPKTARTSRAATPSNRPLRRRERLGKYRIVRRISEGGFATVYEAEDTIEGIRVALRIPRPDLVDKALLDAFRQEVRLLSRLDHPHILKIKNADLIDGLFVVCSRLGQGTLTDAMEGRVSVATALRYIEQLLAASAHVHASGLVHCDIKPDNVILFDGEHARLTDFGIARLARRDTLASGSGTIGYLAPEQALGRPSYRSDVFAIGLVAWQLLSGRVPEWPFEWPYPEADKVKRKVHADLIALLRKSLDVDQRRRFGHAGRMLAEFERLKKGRRLVRAKQRKSTAKPATSVDWHGLSKATFLRRYRKSLQLKEECTRCGFPMSEAMRACPACGREVRKYRGAITGSARCGRCGRGRRLDWRFCAWCFGASFRVIATRRYPDRRYVARCSNARCERKDLAPFMRYCPWCRAKVKRRWTFEGADGSCGRCGCGVVKQLWSFCPWCTRRVTGKRTP